MHLIFVIFEHAIFIYQQRMLSFTGSAKIGWQLKKNAGKMKVSLELGGNASCIVTDSADLSVVIPRLIFGAFYANGKLFFPISLMKQANLASLCNTSMFTRAKLRNLIASL